MSNITVYTDGSSAGNGKINAIGGIGVYFDVDDARNTSKNLKIFCQKYFPEEKNIKSTNNLAELCAIYQALLLLKDNLDNKEYIVIVTDSMYSINSLTKWYKNWEKNGWMNASKKPISNKKVISIIIYDYILKYPNYIKFRHVKAHTKGISRDCIGNHHADLLATKAGSKK